MVKRSQVANFMAKEKTTVIIETTTTTTATSTNTRSSKAQPPCLSPSIMSKKLDPPMATAVPIVASSTSGAHAVAEPSLYIVELPVGCSDLGLKLVGSPPTISDLLKNGPLTGKVTSGHYVHGIVMPGVVIDNLIDSGHLTQLLKANVSGPRSIMVSPSPFFADPVAGTNHKGPLYKHTLPANVSDLGLSMKGFPPAITLVSSNSPLKGRIYEGQGVQAVIIPGQPIFSLQSGGFTDAKVLEKLASTSEIEARQLVVTDENKAGREKGSSKAVELSDCIVQ